MQSEVNDQEHYITIILIEHDGMIVNLRESIDAKKLRNCIYPPSICKCEQTRFFFRISIGAITWRSRYEICMERCFENVHIQYSKKCANDASDESAFDSLLSWFNNKQDLINRFLAHET